MLIGAVGTEFQINTATSANQLNPEVAGLGGSSFVVVWNSGYGYGGELRAQIFDGSGSVGSEFGISDGIYDYAHSVAADASGNFIVVWEDGCGECALEVRARRFDSDGNFIGTEFTVSDPGVDPDVAMTPDGKFVVSWISSSSVRAQRYDAMADPVGTEFVVSPMSSYPYGTAVAAADDGGFVVTWAAANYFSAGPVFSQVARAAAAPVGGGSDLLQGGALFSGAEVFARLYDSNGDSVGSELTVNTYTTFDQRDPDVAMDASGNFVVVWTSDGQDDPGASFYPGVFGQRFNASGDTLGTEFQVNTSTTDAQYDPHVARERSGGNFIVSWTDVGGDGTAGQDGDRSGVFAQRYDGDGTPAGTEFQANTTTLGYQRDSAVATLAPNEFVIVWDGPDGDGDGVWGQRFGPVSP